MNRTELIKQYEKETGNKWVVELVVYNDYAEWLERKLNERQTEDVKIGRASCRERV